MIKKPTFLRIACIGGLATAFAWTLLELTGEITAAFGVVAHAPNGLTKHSALSFFEGAINPTSPLSGEVQPAIAIDDASGLDTSRDVDLGCVMQGDPIQRTFFIRNTSREDISVTKVVKSCSCQSVNLTQDFKWPAGKVLRLTYSAPSSIPGAQAARLLIQTNSKEDSLREISIALNATVTPLVTATPSRLQLGRVLRGSILEKELRISSPNSWVPGEYRGASIVSGTATLSIAATSHDCVTVRFEFPATAPVGKLTDVINIRFAGPNKQLFNIFVPVDGVVEEKAPNENSSISATLR